MNIMTLDFSQLTLQQVTFPTVPSYEPGRNIRNVSRGLAGSQVVMISATAAGGRRFSCLPPARHTKDGVIKIYHTLVRGGVPPPKLRSRYVSCGVTIFTIPPVVGGVQPFFLVIRRC
jgi:hypothetical protein